MAMMIDPKLKVCQTAPTKIELSGNYDGLQLLSLTLAEMLANRETQATIRCGNTEYVIKQEDSHALKETLAKRGSTGSVGRGQGANGGGSFPRTDPSGADPAVSG